VAQMRLLHLLHRAADAGGSDRHALRTTVVLRSILIGRTTSSSAALTGRQLRCQTHSTGLSVFANSHP
jgi:hypothetical protein